VSEIECMLTDEYTREPVRLPDSLYECAFFFVVGVCVCVCVCMYALHIGERYWVHFFLFLFACSTTHASECGVCVCCGHG
jgi:hypothetical protein